MIEFINFRNFKNNYCYDLNKLWNDELNCIFPISNELFLRNTYQTEGFLEDDSYVVIKDNLPVGFVINKIWKHKIEIQAYKNVGWISLIFVCKKERNRGIGTKLLQLSIDAFKKLGVETIYLGRDYQNFFPGLPKDLKAYLGWFQKRGFDCLYETNDLINHLKITNGVYQLLPYNNGQEYEIRLSTTKDFPQMEEFFLRVFPGRWYVEFIDYVQNGGNGSEFMICLDKNHNVCGFVKLCTYQTPINLIGYSLTWQNRFIRLGGIGPLGVDPNYRKNNIAYNLIVSSINNLIKSHCEEIIIDWTNLLDFYRMFNFEIWKTYTYISKNLKEIKK